MRAAKWIMGVVIFATLAMTLYVFALYSTTAFRGIL